MSETIRRPRHRTATAPLLRAVGCLAMVAGLFLLSSVSVVLLMVSLAVPVAVAIPLTIAALSLTPVIARRSVRFIAAL